MQLHALLPEPLRNAPCFLDRLTELWRYEYGEPIKLSNGQTLSGTNMWPPVDVLFDVARCARQRLSSDQHSAFMTSLANPSKHQDYLTEFAPIIRLACSSVARYEARDIAEGNRSIDWLIVTPRHALALEVKNRMTDLIANAERIIAGHKEVDGSAPAPDHSPETLLRSIERKFREADSDVILQGAWIRTQLKQEADEFWSAFNAMDSMRVHFLVLGDFHDDVHVFARSPQITEGIVNVLRVRLSQRGVFTRGEVPKRTG